MDQPRFDDLNILHTQGLQVHDWVLTLALGFANVGHLQPCCVFALILDLAASMTAVLLPPSHSLEGQAF